MRFRLVPTDERFFDLFAEAAENVLNCAHILRDQIADFSTRGTRHKQVIDCERRGDQLTRDILSRLGSSFVTPFDREDIHALAEKLDDVVDDMLAVSDLLNIIHVDEPLPELKEQAEVLVLGSEEMVKLMARFESMRELDVHLESIDSLESQGDAVYRATLGRLFSGDYEALDVLKWKDIVNSMEMAINTVEDISNVVEAIVVKHA